MPVPFAHASPPHCMRKTKPIDTDTFAHPRSQPIGNPRDWTVLKNKLAQNHHHPTRSVGWILSAVVWSCTAFCLRLSSLCLSTCHSQHHMFHVGHKDALLHCRHNWRMKATRCKAIQFCNKCSKKADIQSRAMARGKYGPAWEQAMAVNRTSICPLKYKQKLKQNIRA